MFDDQYFYFYKDDNLYYKDLLNDFFYQDFATLVGSDLGDADGNYSEHIRYTRGDDGRGFS